MRLQSILLLSALLLQPASAMESYRMTLSSPVLLGTDGTGQAEDPLKIELAPFPASVTLVEGDDWSFDFSGLATVTGGDGTISLGDLKWAADAVHLPPGLPLLPSGVMAGTAGAAGVYDFAVTAEAAEARDTQTYTVTINGQPVVVTPVTAFPAALRSGDSVSARYSASPSDGISFSLAPKPAWLSVSTSGQLSGRAPSVTRATPLTFDVVATRGAVSDDERVASTIYPMPSANFSSSQIAGRVGQAISLTPVLDGIVGQARCATTAASGSLPSGVRIGTDCSVSGSPQIGGQQTFTVSGTDSWDGRAFSSNAVTVTVPNATRATSLTFLPADNTYYGGNRAAKFATMSDGISAVADQTPEGGVRISQGNFAAIRPVFHFSQNTYQLQAAITCPHLVQGDAWSSPAPASTTIQVFGLSNGTWYLLRSLTVPYNKPPEQTFNTWYQYPSRMYSQIEFRPTTTHTVCYLAEAFFG